MNECTPNDRVKQIREELNLSQKAFSDRLGVKQSYYSELESRKRGVTARVLQSLIVNFQVSSDWVLTGESQKYITHNEDETLHEDEKDAVLHRYNKMLKRYELGNEEIHAISPNVQSDEGSKQKVPSPLTMPHYSKNNLQILPIVVTPQNTERIVAVPFFAEAGYTRGFQDTDFIQDLPHFSLPQLGEGTYRAFQIRGDSMESSINSGDWVVGRYVDRVQGLQAGTICVVLLKDEGILCKRVEKRGKMGVMLHSNNPRYSPIEPESENILEMWEVRAVLRYLF